MPPPIPPKLHYLHLAEKGYLGYVSLRPGTRRSKIFGFANVEDVFYVRRVISEYGLEITRDIEKTKALNYRTGLLPDAKCSMHERKQTMKNIDIEYIETEQATRILAINNLSLAVISRASVSERHLHLRALAETDVGGADHETNVARLNLIMFDD